MCRSSCLLLTSALPHPTDLPVPATNRSIDARATATTAALATLLGPRIHHSLCDRVLQLTVVAADAVAAAIVY